ncbi:hypothetical protein HT136_20075 [Novosphingobium profundi]|uniref:hypothetical protein n=1 Tax=Novosphingobium profundi TaxID=1774954 RepID=UPI001BDA1FFE|nr:hypothetical protein [Novosphingobium profundi]MBT0670668.1 hypothetical protein [Novosphingobium profundi]
MGNGYKGLEPRNRNGCLIAAIAGLFAFIFLDLGRIFGDPAPGTEDAWWRQVPFLVPTLIAVTITFLCVRFISGRKDSDDS